jgi:allantoinase
MSRTLDRIIKNGSILTPDGMYPLDIGIKNGKIERLAASIADCEADVEVLDAQGLWVLPGVIDAHVHLNEPGMGSWEGFDSGSASLAAGGVTTYIDMPLNGLPPTVDAEALRLKLAAAAGRSHVDYALWGGLVPGNLDRLEELSRLGVVGYKAFMSDPGGEGEGAFRQVDDVTLYEGMRRIAGLGGVLALHAESEPIVSKLSGEALAEKRTTALDFAASRPVLAELEAVGRALLFAELTGCPLHFVHISSQAAVQQITRARMSGLPVTVETCPHYLTLTEKDMEGMGALAKCAPPLRSLKEQELLWEEVRAGRIDWIASDHSPCPAEVKEIGKDGFFGAWGGISGAQSTLELMVTEGIVRRGVSPRLLARLLSEAPARRFGLYPRKGAVMTGSDADLVLLDPAAAYTLRKEDLLYRHPHSPYVGYEFSCRVKATLCRGSIIYKQGQGIVTPGQGQWVRPSASQADAPAFKKEGMA